MEDDRARVRRLWSTLTGSSRPLTQSDYSAAAPSGKTAIQLQAESFLGQLSRLAACRWPSCYKYSGMRGRIAISIAIGLATGTFCWFLMKHFHQDTGDFRWAIHLADRLLAGQNPYDTPLEQYPLTAVPFAIPFVRVWPEIAAAMFWGISSALLAFGITRAGYTRLLIFLAYPYWAGVLAVQWSPLIAASAFFPLLLPATLAKPQVGLPVLLTRFSRRGVIACALVLIATFLAMPRWPQGWLHQAAQYQHFVPMLVLPGPLLLLALLRYRDRDAQFLLISAVMPQRWFFDSFTLWLIPQSRREIIWTVFLSWAPGILRWYHTPHSFSEVGRWTVLFLYLPMMIVILLRKVSLIPRSN